MPDPSGLAGSLPTFPVWGTIIWLTPEQGGRRSGPPPTPWDTYYFATAYVTPHRREDTLASVVIDVSVRDAWQSHAKLRWLADPHPAVGRGSCIFITEGPDAVAIFTVEHVDGSGAHHHPPLSAQHVAEIVDRHRAATPGPWRPTIEGRDHPAGKSFIMTGSGEDRGPDLYVTWDPPPAEDDRGADLDFIAHARHDIPAMADEIGRLRDLLDLLPSSPEVGGGETADTPASRGKAPAVAYVVQADRAAGVVQFGAFTTMREAVKAIDLIQAEDPTVDWVVNLIPVYAHARDFVKDR